MERLRRIAVILVLAAVVCLAGQSFRDCFGAVRERIQEGIEAADKYLEERGLGPIRDEYLEQEERYRHLSQNIVKIGSLYW